MNKIIIFLAFSLTTAVVLAERPRIVGGSLTTINQYPFVTAILQLMGNTHRHMCGGTIINNRSILSAAHCFRGFSVNQFQVRVGSSFASSGGTVHSLSQIFNHANYNIFTKDNDISVIRVSRAFSFGGSVQVGRIVGSNYNLGDNQVVWACGWGLTTFQGSPSEQLRHVQIWTVNQNVCKNSHVHITITPNMLCAGWLNVGGRDVCTQDSGGPLIHNGAVVGVVSFGVGCGDPRYPAVYARVSRYANWIRSHS